jgi:sugar/nucleoside kinase (ribokinase family)
MDLVIIGYLLHDTNIVKDQNYEYVGGSCAYSGITAAKLGMSVGLVSKVGKDFRYTNLLKGIDLRGVKEQEKTTEFVNIYEEERKQKVRNIGEGISFEDIPSEYLECENFLIAPVIGEVETNLIKKLKEKGKTIFCDPQGFLREAKGDEVVYSGLKDREILKYMDVLEASRREIQRINHKPTIEEAMQIEGPKIVITTESHRCLIRDSGGMAEVPAYWIDAVDTTGAGDVFFAGFIFKYLATGNLIESARFGNAVASISVRDAGLKSILKAENLEKEAEAVMKR